MLLLPVNAYPEPTKRKDRFLVQAAWVDDVSANVIEKWNQLQQAVGKAGKGTAWAEYKLESQLTVPSIVSQSIIFEDEEEGSTPGSTPTKGSPRHSPADAGEELGNNLLEEEEFAANFAASATRVGGRAGSAAGNPQTAEAGGGAPAAAAPADEAAAAAAAAGREPSATVVKDRQRTAALDDEAEARAMMAETNRLVQEQIYDDMLQFKVERPRSSVAQWCRVSDWARDTGGPKDASGAPLRAMGGENTPPAKPSSAAPSSAIAAPCEIATPDGVDQS